MSLFDVFYKFKNEPLDSDILIEGLLEYMCGERKHSFTNNDIIMEFYYSANRELNLVKHSIEGGIYNHQYCIYIKFDITYKFMCKEIHNKRSNIICYKRDGKPLDTMDFSEDQKIDLSGITFNSLLPQRIKPAI